MRTKSENKYDDLLKATLSMINDHGFHDAPMSKIAKMAGVSPATIYLYFENKQDLINKLYLEIKASFSQYAFKDYDPEMPVKKEFESIWFNIADYKLNKMDEAMFLLQCDNSPMIDEESRQEGLKHLQPLLDLWERGKREGIIKPISPFLLYANTIYPFSFLMSMHERKIHPMTSEDLQAAYQAAWDAIKV